MLGKLEMASFVGTNKEFRRYIGPMLRNLIQQITKARKAEISACEHCGSKTNLESAHVKGRDRNDILDDVLDGFTNNGIATVNLAVFEEKFKAEHQPLEKCILILCRECHKEYDSVSTKAAPLHPRVAVTPGRSPSANIAKEGYLPITLEPSDPEIFKRELLRSKKAEIITTYSTGKIDRKLWNAKNFKYTSNVFGNLRTRAEYRSGNWQSRGISKVHVRVVENA
jgi:hypothetical protein